MLLKLLFRVLLYISILIYSIQESRAFGNTFLYFFVYEEFMPSAMLPFMNHLLFNFPVFVAGAYIKNKIFFLFSYGESSYFPVFILKCYALPLCKLNKLSYLFTNYTVLPLFYLVITVFYDYLLCNENGLYTFVVFYNIYMYLFSFTLCFA